MFSGGRQNHPPQKTYCITPFIQNMQNGYIYRDIKQSSGFSKARSMRVEGMAKRHGVLFGVIRMFHN